MAVQPDNFLALDPEDSDYERSRYVILPVPYEATTTFGAGTRLGPRAIVTASQQLELFDVELGRECHGGGIATLAPLEPDSRGPEAMVARVREAALPVVRAGKFLIGLGGEHTISAGLVQAVREVYGEVSVLCIDAHADLRDRYQGSPFSHACVMRRVHEMGAAVVLVGTRCVSREEHEFMVSAGIRAVRPEEVRREAAWVDRVVEGLGERVYVTVDIDGLDPSEAPGAGTPEPGGLRWEEVCRLLRAVADRRRVVGADVVEVVPVPGQVVTEYLAARLVYKMIAYDHVRQCR